MKKFKLLGHLIGHALYCSKIVADDSTSGNLNKSNVTKMFTGVYLPKARVFPGC